MITPSSDITRNEHSHVCVWVVAFIVIAADDFRCGSVRRRPRIACASREVA